MRMPKSSTTLKCPAQSLREARVDNTLDAIIAEDGLENRNKTTLYDAFAPR